MRMHDRASRTKKLPVPLSGPRTPRRFGFAYRESMDLENPAPLEKMCSRGPGWYKANGRLRLCLDPKDLNRAIKRDHYPVPTLEEIILKLSDAKMFSKLDPRNQKRLLERRVRWTIYVFYHIQHPFWPIPILENAFWSQDESGCISTKDRWNLLCTRKHCGHRWRYPTILQKCKRPWLSPSWSYGKHQTCGDQVECRKMHHQNEWM